VTGNYLVRWGLVGGLIRSIVFLIDLGIGGRLLKQPYTTVYLNPLRGSISDRTNPSPPNRYRAVREVSWVYLNV
jgi:hypothetical protein